MDSFRCGPPSVCRSISRAFGWSMDGNSLADALVTQTGPSRRHRAHGDTCRPPRSQAPVWTAGPFAAPHASICTPQTPSIPFRFHSIRCVSSQPGSHSSRGRLRRPAQSAPSSLRLGAPASLGSTSMTTPTDRSPPSPPRRISDPRLRASTLDSVAPYVRHQRTTRLAEKEVVEGVFPPALRAIPYTGKLPHPHMPTHLATTLSSGSRKEIIDRVWKAFLPRSVDSETYGPFFKNSTGLKSTAWSTCILLADGLCIDAEVC